MLVQLLVLLSTLFTNDDARRVSLKRLFLASPDDLLISHVYMSIAMVVFGVLRLYNLGVRLFCLVDLISIGCRCAIAIGLCCC